MKKAARRKQRYFSNLKRMRKKASLEISIQAIVIVVLAMTLLGLGLGFVRDLFGNIQGTTGDVAEQVKQRVIDDLITGDKKLSFPKTEVKVNLGEAAVLTVGVRNKNNIQLDYGMRIDTISVPDEAIGTQYEDIDQWFQYGRDQVYSLTPADSDVRNLRLSIPKDAPIGSYFLNFIVYDDFECPGGFAIDPDCVYAQKDIFVVVRG